MDKSRFTLNLPSPLLERARAVSVLTGRSVTSLFVEGLGKALNDQAAAIEEEQIEDRIAELRRSVRGQ